MKTLNVILGAGFSYDAGLPLSAGIDRFFTRDNREKLLRFYSSEWFWVDGKSDGDIHNGKNNWDAISYSYILNMFVDAYTKANNGFINYEHFYQFLVDLERDKPLLNTMIERARASFLDDFPDVPSDSNYFYAFSDRDHSKILDIVNYLIADLLKPEKSIEILSEIYSSFLGFIRGYEQVNIFTLNHDTLIEGLLDHRDLKWFDGFSREDVDLKYQDKYQRCFKGDLPNEGIKLIKLHGSIDLFRYDHLETVKSGVYQRAANYTYYKPDGYSAKHHVVRVDSSGEVLQDFHSDVVPKFITGTRKEELIESDPMYRWGMDQLHKALTHSSDLLICGYSFGDDHVNEVLKECNKGQYGRIININPGGFDIYDVKTVESYGSIKEFN
jgi:hypothetical protein